MADSTYMYKCFVRCSVCSRRTCEINVHCFIRFLHCCNHSSRYAAATALCMCEPYVCVNLVWTLCMHEPYVCVNLMYAWCYVCMSLMYAWALCMREPYMNLMYAWTLCEPYVCMSLTYAWTLCTREPYVCVNLVYAWTHTHTPLLAHVSHNGPTVNFCKCSSRSVAVKALCVFVCVCQYSLTLVRASVYVWLCDCVPQHVHPFMLILQLCYKAIHPLNHMPISEVNMLITYAYYILHMLITYAY